MIIDTLEHIDRCVNLGRNFAQAVEFLLGTDLSALSLGKGEIDDGRVYYDLQENVLNRGNPVWEAHEQYADIQLILRGRERFGWGIAGWYDPMNLEKDYCACRAVEGFDFTLSQGQFVIFMPGEPHAPGLFGGEDRCLKLVVKVLTQA